MSISVQDCSRDKMNGWINNEIHVSNMWKCMTGLGIQTRDPCITRKELHVSRPISIHGSRSNYHIPFLTKFFFPFPLRNSQQTHVHSVRTWSIKQMLDQRWLQHQRNLYLENQINQIKQNIHCIVYIDIQLNSFLQKMLISVTNDTKAAI